MTRFNNYLNEALITFNNKRPKYNTALIMAGGAGSGKGFIQSNLIGIEGKIFDVDNIKKMVLKSAIIRRNLEKKFGDNLNDLDMKNEKHVSLLHTVIKKSGLNTAQQELLKKTINPNNDHKPNIIFDVTLKNMHKFQKTVFLCNDMGYKPKDIHMVWVLNKVSVALQQNKERDRYVNPEIVLQTHEGVRKTMFEILVSANYPKKYFDGDIWITFNERDVDTEFVTSDITRPNKIIKSKKGNGSYLKKATSVKIKETGKKPISIKSLKTNLQNKIENYPNPNNIKVDEDEKNQNFLMNKIFDYTSTLNYTDDLLNSISEYDN